MMADIPGPAGGGEGYNVNRDDRNFVAVHAGVVSNEDGPTTSVLNSTHRFDNPVARIVVTRIDSQRPFPVSWEESYFYPLWYNIY